MIHHLHYSNYGGRKELSRDERDALKQRTANLHTQSVADLRTTWRVALKKEAEDRAAEIQELCKLHDLSALNTQLSELVAAEAALPPLHTIRPECYACALPIVGFAVRGAHGRVFHERCFVCHKCNTHLSALAPTCVALYDQHYCMPCGAPFEPREATEVSTAAKQDIPAKTSTPQKPTEATATATPSESSPAPQGDARDQAKSRLLNAFSKLSTHVTEMDEEEKKLIAKIEEEEAALKDMQRRQRVERFRARQGSINLPVGQKPTGLDAAMAAVKASQPDAIDAETLKSLDKEQKLYTSSEQARKKAEQQERLMKFKAGLSERKGDIARSSESIDEEESEKRRKEQEILDLIAEEERRRQEDERKRQVANVRYFLDDLKESTLAVLEREATGGRVSAKELDVVERNLQRADSLFGVNETTDVDAPAGEGRFERTLDKLLSLMENPDALSKLAQLVSPNVAPQGQSHVAFYEKVKQDTEWARKQREARQAELASMRRN